MNKLTRQDLMSLEDYSAVRTEFRRRAIEHKKQRRLALSPNATLHFEDRLTMQYQIQEMLRAEKIFEAAGIQEELDTYNDLIPSGENWIATLMFEYDDPVVRARELRRMVEIEHRLYTTIGRNEPIFAIANEDLDRSDHEKTSAVHFVRFQLNGSSIDQVRAGASIQFGIDHPTMPCCVTIPMTLRTELLRDLTV